MNNISGRGELYGCICKKVFRKLGPDDDRLKKIIKEKDERLNLLEQEFRQIENDFRTKIVKLSEKERKRETKKFCKIETKFRRLRKSAKQEELRNALNILGLKLELYEVAFFANLVAFISFLWGFLGLIIISLISFEMGIILMGMSVALVFPLLVHSLILTYPTILAKRIKVSSLARTPEAINYMIMSMRLLPSLDKAVEFAADNTDEPISSALKKILWDIYMRRHNTIEEAFLAFAYDWSDSEDFKRSLYAIGSSALERTEEGLARTLDKASRIVLDGTKRRIEEFISTLTTPTTVLFSLGILLPLIIGAMLPMLSLGLISPDLGMDTVNAGNQSDNVIGMAFLMDVVFPLTGALYAYHILGKRPGTSIVPRMKIDAPKDTIRNLRIISITPGLILVISGIWVIVTTQHILGAVLIVWGIGFPIFFYYFSVTRISKKKKDEILKMEEELPDALFQLGSRIAEGYPVEAALRMASETMKDSKIARLFDRISVHIRITRTTLEDALFGANGILKESQSKTITAAMKVVVELTKKDSFSAGQAIVTISNYLRDMKNLEHEIKVSLKSSVDSMKATGMLFAPLVMGVTSALYFLLFGVFEDFGAGTQMMPPYLFLLIIGIYLLLTVMVIMYFCTGIEHGADPVERRYQTAVGIPVALLVFTITTFAASAGLGT